MRIDNILDIKIFLFIWLDPLREIPQGVLEVLK